MIHRQRVLIVDDDPEIRDLIALSLKNHFETRSVGTGEKALEALWSFTPHVLLLDLKLPGFQGDSLIQLIRRDAKVKDLPIVVLTGDRREAVHLEAFKSGADDVLTKPFSPLELAARLRALLRRGGQTNGQETLDAGTLSLSTATHEVKADGKLLDLTPTEYSLLLMLLESCGKVVSKTTMIENLWGSDEEMRTRTIDTHINNLRRKLGKSGSLIQTVRKFGLRIAPTR